MPDEAGLFGLQLVIGTPLRYLRERIAASQMQKHATTNVRDRSREVVKSLKRFVIMRINTGQLGPGDKIPT